MTNAEIVKNILENEPGSIEGKFINRITDYICSTWFPSNSDGTRYDSFEESFCWDLTAKVLLLIQREIDAYIFEYMKTGDHPPLWRE